MWKLNIEFVLMLTEAVYMELTEENTSHCKDSISATPRSTEDCIYGRAGSRKENSV